MKTEKPLSIHLPTQSYTSAREEEALAEAVIGEAKLTTNGFYVRIFAAAPSRPPVLSPPMVMVVEDDDVTARLIEHILLKADYRVVRAANRAEIIVGFRAEPDLVLLDVMLPDLNGFDVLDQIRSNEKTKNLPVLMLSSLGSLGDIMKGFTLGANGYLTKPAESAALLAAIEEVLIQ